MSENQVNADEMIRLLAGSSAEKEEAFALFHAHTDPDFAGVLLDTWLALAVAEGNIAEDEVSECKSTLESGTDVEITFTGHSENIEPCLFKDGDKKWPGCEVLESNTDFAVEVPTCDATALAAVCACLAANFWNSTAPLDFTEESMSDESSEFWFLGQDGKRQSGQPETTEGVCVEPEYSGDGESVYYARNFSTAASFSPSDFLPDVVAGVPCVWILAVLAKVQWSDLAAFDAEGHLQEIEKLIQGSFSYFS